MKRLLAAFMFLTRLPAPGHWNFTGPDVARSTLFFPVVGAAIGAIQWGVLAATVWVAHWVGQRSGHLYSVPAPVLAVMIVIVGAWITGALHMDGLADMADGFGGGRTREDVLRIMRDHTIGAYGAVALILVLGLKIAGILSLLEHGSAWIFLVVAPALARASNVVLGFALPYARIVEGGLGGIVQDIGVSEVVFSSLTAVVLALALAGWRGGVALLVTTIASLENARRCRKRIQGVTGDTMGANVEICEALIFATGAILTS
jgi:adenosylcobinamide-GDP ribazoletransferase